VQSIVSSSVDVLAVVGLLYALLLAPGFWLLCFTVLAKEVSWTPYNEVRRWARLNGRHLVFIPYGFWMPLDLSRCYGTLFQSYTADVMRTTLWRHFSYVTVVVLVNSAVAVPNCTALYVLAAFICFGAGLYCGTVRLHRDWALGCSVAVSYVSLGCLNLLVITSLHQVGGDAVGGLLILFSNFVVCGLTVLSTAIQYKEEMDCCMQRELQSLEASSHDIPLLEFAAGPGGGSDALLPLARSPHRRLRRKRMRKRKVAVNIVTADSGEA
jgi:hypothetical protein